MELYRMKTIRSLAILLLAGVFLTAAAGQQSHDHGQGQQEREYFFHIEDYSFFRCLCSRDGLSINTAK